MPQDASYRICALGEATFGAGYYQYSIVTDDSGFSLYVLARDVEGFFAKLAKRRLRRGVFGSLIEVQAAIKRFIAESNGDPKPFVWTADPDRIIQAAKRGHQVLDSHH